MSMPTHPEVVTLDPSNDDDMARLVEAFYNTDETHAPTAMAKAVRALAAPTLPAEPPLYTVVHVPSLNQWQRWTRLDQPTGRNWVDNRADWSSWEQVCALGTPEVLEPDSVKALREKCTAANSRGAQMEIERDEAQATLEAIRAEFRKAFTVDFGGWDWRDDDAIQTLARALSRLLSAKPATEDEPAEPAPVEEMAEWERALLTEVTDEPTDPNARVKDARSIEWGKSTTDGCTGCWEATALEGGRNLGHRSWRGLRGERGPLTLVETGGQS